MAFYQTVYNKVHRDLDGGDSNAEFLREYVPQFFGTVSLNLQQKGELLHLVLSDVTLPYKRPSIMDVKVGHQTWYDGAAPEYIEKCKMKDNASTSSTLGFKVCGLQLYNGQENDFWRPGKQWSKHLDVEQVRKVVAMFCGYGSSSMICIERQAALLNSIIAEVQAIRQWFENQKSFHFYSASLLVLYEGIDRDEHGRLLEPNVKIYLVDFAHTFRPKCKEYDQNFIEGLRCFEKELMMLRNIDTSMQ